MLPWHFPEDLPSILPQQRKTNPHKEQKITLSIPVGERCATRVSPRGG